MQTVLILLIVTLAAQAQPRDGKLRVVYIPAKTPMGNIWERSIQAGQFYEKAAGRLTNYINWPRDVVIEIGEIGVANCFYYPIKHRIVVGYEMYNLILQEFSKIEPAPQALKHTFLTMDHIFYHEVGHCLVGELDLPITGREEDAADDLAAISLAEGGDYGSEVAFASAQFFELLSRRRDTKDLPFWDEHSLEMQRCYNILSIFYGCDPNRYQFIEKIVPAKRLAKSEREFKHKQRSWDRILNQHLRNPKDSRERF